MIISHCFIFFVKFQDFDEIVFRLYFFTLKEIECALFFWYFLFVDINVLLIFLEPTVVR
jgi:hypothetical protein